MSFPTSGVAVPPQQPWVPQSYYNIPNLPYPSETFVQQQNTIAPSQLGQDSMLKPSKSFSDLMAEGRGSSSSTDSNEPGQDWIGNALENWTWPMQQALISDPRPKQRRVSKPRINDPGTSFQVQSLQPPVPRPLPFAAGYTDLETTVRQYVFSPNRLAEGERKMVVMTPKVGQKSYGTEKRFLCPHPQAALVGQAWWTRSKDHCPISPIHPPRVNISLIGEQPVKDAGVSWTTIAGHSLDDKTPVTLGDRPFLGNVAGKNLYISDNDAKRRDVKAQVAVKVPFDYHAGPNGWGPSKGSLSDISNDKVLGTFESKEIKVISKPSKKKTNSKSGDRKSAHWTGLIPVLIPHGSTVALFNRVKSQTASTRYLSVVPDATRILGSDGKHVLGAVPPLPSSTENLFRGFIAHASVWESFIIWLVDLSKPVGPGLNPPLHPDWPRAPSNAIAPSLLAPSIRYNSTVILQSVQTGLCSPILVLRRVEQDAEVVGGDGTSSEMSAAHPEGEQLGDLVSQLQKIAFEVYSDSMVRSAGLWLACDQDEVVEKSVHADRKWSAIASSQSRSRPSSVSSTPNQRFGVLPMTPHTGSVNLPSTPSSPNSNTSSLDYFGSHSRKASSSSLMSPISSDAPLPSTDGGPIRRQRTGSASRGPLGRPAHKKRQSADSAASSFEHLQNAYPSTGDVPKFYWSLDVGDVCVWSIVSTEQTTYTFYVPSHVKEIDQPIAPFPMANRILLPNAPMDMGPASMKMHSTFTSRSDAPLITM